MTFMFGRGSTLIIYMYICTSHEYEKEMNELVADNVII